MIKYGTHKTLVKGEPRLNDLPAVHTECLLYVIGYTEFFSIEHVRFIRENLNIRHAVNPACHERVVILGTVCNEVRVG